LKNDRESKTIIDIFVGWFLFEWRAEHAIVTVGNINTIKIEGTTTTITVYGSIRTNGLSLCFVKPTRRTTPANREINASVSFLAACRCDGRSIIDD